MKKRLSLLWVLACAAVLAGVCLAAEKGDEPAKATSFDLGNGVTLEMVSVKGGTFRMGSSLSPAEIMRKYTGGESWRDWYQAEVPAHDVTVSGFLTGKYEVTRAQFAQFIKETKYKTDAEKSGDALGYDVASGSWKQIKGLKWDNPGFPQDGTHPVTCVSWYDARMFCGWLTQKTKTFFRMPTEAEWEYACRAGTETDFTWGANPAGGQGWLNGADLFLNKTLESQSRKLQYYFPWDDGYAYTAPVGHYRPNAWGLYDMHGNVWEWCLDWHTANFYGMSPRKNPGGADWGVMRVFRGGGWHDFPAGVRSSFRGKSGPGHAYDYLGFRVISPVAAP